MFHHYPAVAAEPYKKMADWHFAGISPSASRPLHPLYLHASEGQSWKDNDLRINAEEGGGRRLGRAAATGGGKRWWVCIFNFTMFYFKVYLFIYFILLLFLFYYFSYWCFLILFFLFSFLLLFFPFFRVCVIFFAVLFLAPGFLFRYCFICCSLFFIILSWRSSLVWVRLFPPRRDPPVILLSLLYHPFLCVLF